MSGQIYDLTRDDYAFRPVDEGQRGHIACWNGLNPRPGDYLILCSGAETTRYQVVSTDPCLNVDPPTMWMADLTFAPRTEGGSGGDGARTPRRFPWLLTARAALAAFALIILAWYLVMPWASL